MITTNVIQRTFQLRFEDSIGTCFTVDHDRKQYIVTAKHCIEGLADGDIIEIFRGGEWKRLPVSLVGHGPDDVDVSVVSPPQQISPVHPLPATTAHMVYGQDVFFLGFPFGLASDSKDLNGGFPFPLVKKATLSAIDFGPNAVMLLDGLNNPGFSGGPVVFTKPGSSRPDYSVAAVISGYRFNRVSVDHRGSPTPLTVNENTGIIIAYSINHAVRLIEKNPIGFPLPEIKS
jgi:S1-C subfamily serine protease